MKNLCFLEVLVLPKVEILNSKLHADLKVNTDFDVSFNDAGPIVAVVADELPMLAIDFPVFITKNPNTGEFELSAVLGFDSGENLYIKSGRWLSHYVPLNIQRQPFQACFLNSSESTSTLEEVDSNSEVKLGLNVESHRLNAEVGEPLFNKDGSVSKYVEVISSILGGVLTGTKLTRVFLRLLADQNLIVPAKLDIQVSGKKEIGLSGLYSIDPKGLANLPDEHVLGFHKKGYFQACYAMLHSHGNLHKLLERKGQRETTV